MPPWGVLCPLRDKLPSVELKKDEYTVGRGTKCSVVINETHLSTVDFDLVSKKHFKISRKTNGVYLEGFSLTYINDKKIGPAEKTILKHNDRIAIGKMHLKVFVYLDKKECDKASQNLPDSISEKYLIACPLGQGAFGEVSLIFEKDKGKMFALKTVMKNPKLLTYAHTEKNILQKINHPCVIRTEEVVDRPSYLFIVLEFMEGGDLSRRVRPVKSLNEPHIKLIFFQLAQAIQYLHQQNIVHRDIKPENILLASKESETLIKVADFGISKILREGTQMDTRVGTPYYQAPEISDAPKRAYTKQVDIWSMGILLYFCLSSEFPFESRDDVKRGVRFSQHCWKVTTGTVTDLIKGMLIPQPKDRIELNMVLSHPWLQDDTMRRKAHCLMWPDKPYVADSPPPALPQRYGSLRQTPRGVMQYMSSNQNRTAPSPNRPQPGMGTSGQLQMQPAAIVHSPNRPQPGMGASGQLLIQPAAKVPAPNRPQPGMGASGQLLIQPAAKVPSPNRPQPGMGASGQLLIQPAAKVPLPNRPQPGMGASGQLLIQPAAKVPSPNRPQPGMGASGQLLIQPAAKVPSPNRPQSGMGASGQLLIQPAAKVPSLNRPQPGMGASGQLLIQPAAKVPSPNRPQPGMGASGQLLIQPAAKVPSPNRPQPGMVASRQLQMQPATKVPAPNAVRVSAPGTLQDAARELYKPSVKPAAQNAMQPRQPYAAGVRDEPAKSVKDAVQRFERK